MIPIFQFLHSPSFHNNTTRGKQRKIKILISNLKIPPILGIKEKHIFFFPDRTTWVVQCGRDC